MKVFLRPRIKYWIETRTQRHRIKSCFKIVRHCGSEMFKSAIFKYIYTTDRTQTNTHAHQERREQIT